MLAKYGTPLLIGLLIGAFFAVINFVIVWVANKKSAVAGEPSKQKNVVLGAFALRYVLNIGAFVLAFLLRSVIPGNDDVLLAGVAVGLVVLGRILIMLRGGEGFAVKGIDPLPGAPAGENLQEKAAETEKQ